MLLLLYSGSTHSFVSSSFVTRAGLSTVPIAPKQVKLPNGDLLTCDRMVPQLIWWCQGHTLSADMRVLDMGVYDGILGYDLLQLHSPMKCHWQNKTIEFQAASKAVELQGIQPMSLHISESSIAQVRKWDKGNDIWAYAIVEMLDAAPSDPIPESIAKLLLEYSDLFQDPKTLPPQTIHDHSISLLPDALPTNSRPYRYSPLQKTEIER